MPDWSQHSAGVLTVLTTVPEQVPSIADEKQSNLVLSVKNTLVIYFF